MSELESWVTAEEVRRHIGGRFTRDHILVMARRGQLPARNMGWGKRRAWVFRLSEVDQAINQMQSAEQKKRVP